MTPDTLFYTGSTTKSFTAAGLSLLIDNSSSYSGISWQTPVSHLLRDDFVLSDEWATEHITLEDALSHRTGYPRHDLSIRNSTVQLVRSLRHLPMSAEPLARFQYNNMMYATAGYVLEKLTGLDLGAFFHEYLWGPTGMGGTFLDVFDPRLHEGGRALAKSYWWVNATQSYVLNPNIEGRMRGDAGAGAVISNVVDYTKYLRVMMAEAGPISKKGHLELKRPWSRKTLRRAPRDSTQIFLPRLRPPRCRWDTTQAPITIRATVISSLPPVVRRNLSPLRYHRAAQQTVSVGWA